MKNLISIANEMELWSWFDMIDIIELYVNLNRSLQKIQDDLYLVMNEYSKVVCGKEKK